LAPRNCKFLCLYKIVSSVNLIVGVIAILFSIYAIFAFQNFCFRVDEIKGCGFWSDANLNIIIPSLFWIFAPIYYFMKKSKISAYFNLLAFFATPILFILIVKSF